jgi:hypothetical protein
MRITSTSNPPKKPSKPTPTPVSNTLETSSDEAVGKEKSWRQITLSEAIVEIPQSVLELSRLDEVSPLAAKGAQLAISGIAAVRAFQCFQDAESLEEVLEGVSSSALALAGGATLLPMAGASLWNQGFLVGHGATELLLGIREIREETRKDQPAKLELAGGLLDSVKGASTFLPLIAPGTADAVNLFQIGAILTKTILEPHMRRSQRSE